MIFFIAAHFCYPSSLQLLLIFTGRLTCSSWTAYPGVQSDLHDLLTKPVVVRGVKG
jgi:hypothetical protein